jgi:hypothetical protein
MGSSFLACFIIIFGTFPFFFPSGPSGGWGWGVGLCLASERERLFFSLVEVKGNGGSIIGSIILGGV